MTAGLRNELRTRVERWVDANFNLLPLEVVEREHEHHEGNHLSASIEHGAYDLWDDDERTAALAVLSDHGYDFAADCEDWEIEEALFELRCERYPMWGTLFESRRADYPNDDACRAAGFVTLRGFGDFNDMLGVAGCGYSFYGAHWIPLWLMVQDEETRSRYAGIDLGSM